MVAPTWITPGCMQFLKNKKRFYTAWVIRDRLGLSASCPGYPRSRPLGRTSRFGSFVPKAEVVRSEMREAASRGGLQPGWKNASTIERPDLVERYDKALAARDA